MNFAEVTDVAIQEGAVSAIYRDGVCLWKAGETTRHVGLTERTLKVLRNSVATRIRKWAFASWNTETGCSALEAVDFPNVKVIEEYAFTGAEHLKKVNFPEATDIGRFAFWDRVGLTDVYFPKAVNIGGAAFRDNDTILKADFPMAVNIDDGAFGSCRNLSEINFPVAETIGVTSFYRCGLYSVELPKVKTIGERAFYQNTSLRQADFSNVESIGDQAFAGCTLFYVLILRNTQTVCNLEGSSVFTDTDIGDKSRGYVYVPRFMVSAYQAHSAWSSLSDRIRAIEDYPEIVGG